MKDILFLKKSGNPQNLTQILFSVDHRTENEKSKIFFESDQIEFTAQLMVKNSMNGGSIYCVCDAFKS